LGPARPAAADGPDGAEKVYAARDLAMVVSDPNIGYDLDGVCTCDAREGALRGGASTCAPRRANDALCDSEGGRDNAGAAILRNRLPEPGAAFDVGYRAAAAEGLSGLLFSLTEYNGGADDPSVRVEAYDSPGTGPRPPCDAGEGADAGTNTSGAPRPRWDGCDAWRVGESYLQGGVARTGTREAWVAGGRLFARFASLRLRVDRSYVTLLDARVEAIVARDPDRLTGGVVAGIVAASELLVAFGELRTGAEGRPLCTTPAFQSLVDDTCANLDVALRTAPEGTLAPCDGASIVLVFEAGGAKRGPVAPDGTVATSCAEAGVFPACR